MSAYLVCMVRVDDPETYKRYTAETPAIIAKHGGRFLVRGGAVENIEGPPFGDRLVIVEFPSFEQAVACYEDEEYQASLPFAHAASERELAILEAL